MVSSVHELQAKIVRVALPVSKELVPKGADQVTQLLKSAEEALENFDEETAFKTVIQGAALVFRVRADYYLQALDHEKEPIDQALGHKGEWIAREAVKVCKLSGDEQTEALSLVLAADAAICNADGRKAEKCALAALESFRNLRDKWGEASALHSYVTAKIVRYSKGPNVRLPLAEKSEQKIDAVLQRKLKALDPALQAAKDVSAIYADLGQPRFEAAGLNQVAEVHIARQETVEAKKVAREVRDMFEDLDDPVGEAAALKLILKANLVKSDDYVDAVFAAKNVIKVLKGKKKVADSDQKRAIAQAHFTLAKTHLALQESKEAIEAAEESIRLYDELYEQKTRVKVPILHAIAQAHSQTKNREAAIKMEQRCIELCKKDGDRKSEAECLHNMAKMELEIIFKYVEESSAAVDEAVSAEMGRAWSLTEQSMTIYKELKDKEGEGAVAKTIQDYTEKAKKLQKKMTSAPTRTVYYMDPDTRKITVQDFYDPPEKAAAITA